MQSLMATNAACTLPVYRPLIGFDKKKSWIFLKRLIRTRHRSSRMKTAVRFFVAKHPVTKPNLERIEKSERNLDEKIDELMQTAIDTVETIMVK